MEESLFDIVSTYDRAHWQPLLELIPEIESMRSFGKMIPITTDKRGVMTFPYVVPEEVVVTLLHTVYNLNIVLPFDWMSWKEGADILDNETFDYHTIDIPTLCKLLTAIVRNDRFSEGYLVSAFEKGIILKILMGINNQLP